MKPRFEHQEHRTIHAKNEQLHTMAIDSWNNNHSDYPGRIDHLLGDFSRHDMRSIRGIVLESTNSVLSQKTMTTYEFVEARFGINYLNKSPRLPVPISGPALSTN